MQLRAGLRGRERPPVLRGAEASWEGVLPDRPHTGGRRPGPEPARLPDVSEAGDSPQMSGGPEPRGLEQTTTTMILHKLLTFRMAGNRSPVSHCLGVTC